MAKPSDEDITAATSLLRSGWRQGVAFRLPASLHLPTSSHFDRDRDFLVICTQSCCLLSASFDADPFVEVLEARPLVKLISRSPEATGKNVRRFHLPIGGLEDAAALECDINRRFVFCRRQLLTCSLSGAPIVERDDTRRFAGWLARYFGRAALPNELVRRARADGAPFAVIEAALRSMVQGKRVSDGVHSIFLRATPDTELEADGSDQYTVKLRIICHENETQEYLDRYLLEALAGYARGKVVGGIALDFGVDLTSQVTMADLQGYERFSDLDYLSGLAEVRGSVADQPEV